MLCTFVQDYLSYEYLTNNYCCMHKLICSGDFAILLSTGLKWRVALLFNFLSSLTAVVGFFVGVAIGTSSVESNNWILTAAVGLFLYVALVDLVR